MCVLLKAVSRLRFNTSPGEFVKETSMEQARVTLEEKLTTQDVKYWE
ncbi:hypothetical protein LSAT2_004943 [Lamellibrachia satsuma]|nr:hypothetical protein LSAT2_004943 [Lamellibrachia satsuma]